MASRTDALKVVAAVGLASLVRGEEANNRDVVDNFGRDRRLQYQDEAWYNLPDPAMNGQQPPPPMMYEEPPMHNAYVETPAMHYNPPMHQNPPMHGGASWWQGSDAMPEAKGGKEHGSETVSNGWWEPAWQEAAKASKTHNEGAASGWWQAAPEKVHVPEASGWWEAGSAKSEKVHHPEPSWGWWEAGSAKAKKSGKSKSAKHSSGWNSWEWSGSMPTTTHATTPATTTTTTAGWSTIPAAKGDKPHDSGETTTTTSTWWAAPSWTDGAKSHKSAKSKAAKSAKSAKTGGEGGSEWESTWTPPTPCGKAEDCPEQTVPVPPSGEHMEANTESASIPTSSPLVPITMAPVAGMGTEAPTTIIDGLTREAGWFQSGKDYETAELQYKRERVEGLAKQMEWKNSSSRPQVISYLAVVAAAGVYYILC